MSKFYAIVDEVSNLVVNVIEAPDNYVDTDPGFVAIVCTLVVQTGYSYDPISGLFSPPPPTNQQMLDYLINDPYYTTHVPFIKDGNSYTALNDQNFIYKVFKAFNEPSTDTLDVICDDGVTLMTMTNAEFLGILNAIGDGFQSGLTAYEIVAAAIDDSEYTTYAEVDAAYAIAVAAVPARTTLDPVRVLIDEKQDQSDALDAVSEITPGAAGLTILQSADVATAKAALAITSTDLSDFNSATDARVSTKIDALLNGADAAHDTLVEIQNLLNTDEGVAAALATTVGGKVDKISGKGLSTNDYTTTEQTKLSGISTGATKVKVYSLGTTGAPAERVNPIMVNCSGVVASNIVTFQLTTDGTSTGTALFPNGPITGAMNVFVNSATAAYQDAGVWSNSNKTLTITANKLTTSNILTGILGQAAANGDTITAQVWGY